MHRIKCLTQRHSTAPPVGLQQVTLGSQVFCKFEKKFAKILVSQIALKDMFAMLKIRDKGMIYLYQ